MSLKYEPVSVEDGDQQRRLGAAGQHHATSDAITISSDATLRLMRGRQPYA